MQPLGVLDEWAPCVLSPVVLREGGALLLVTDGIFEAMAHDGEQLGVERMCVTLDAHRSSPPHELVEALRDQVSAWYAGRDPADDQTIVIVRRSAAADRRKGRMKDEAEG